MSKMSSKTIAKNPHRNVAQSCITSVRVFHGVKSCVLSVHNGIKVIRFDESGRQPSGRLLCLLLSRVYRWLSRVVAQSPITIVIYISWRRPLLLLGCLSLSPFGGGACAPPPPRRGVPKATHNNPTKDCFKKWRKLWGKNAAQKCFTKMQQNGERKWIIK